VAPCEHYVSINKHGQLGTAAWVLLLLLLLL
jgi:hypothetical protein